MTPRILGHRGASGHAPENTLAAFTRAGELGADGVELDIHTTADGHFIVHHDPVLPGSGPIARMDWADLRTIPLPSGEPILQLDEVLAALAGREVWVEIKALPPESDSSLLAVIAGSPRPDRCAVHSFDHRVVARLGELNPGLRRGILSASYPIDPMAQVRAAGAGTLWQEWHLIDAGLVRLTHDAGIEIVAWTVNKDRDARHLAALGVDALCGNYPERLRVG